jgi:HD superfamily phosphohydrolase
MIVDDIVYGKIEIRDSLILSLIQSRAVQRLRHINQHGSWAYILENDNTTRYDHSVGVYHLLRHFGAELEEQTAGLIHDVPHTAFSHVIDYVYGKRESMEFHEDIAERVVMGSDIPSILKPQGFDASRFIHNGNFPLLERDIPDLCCDRLDYFFRDSVFFGVCSKDDVMMFMASLIVNDGEIICREAEAAKEMAMAYLETSEKWWASPMQAASYEILAKAIKAGLDKGVIREEDLLKTDDYVYGLLKGSGNKDILSILEMIAPGLKVEENSRDYDFKTSTKARYIDTKVLFGQKTRRVSEIYPDFAKRLKRFRQRIAKGYYIKILNTRSNFNTESQLLEKRGR